MLLPRLPDEVLLWLYDVFICLFTMERMGGISSFHYQEITTLNGVSIAINRIPRCLSEETIPTSWLNKLKQPSSRLLKSLANPY